MINAQKIAEMDNITGLTNQGMLSNRLSQLREVRLAKQQEEADKPKGFEKVIGKIADFTGGKELGQGLATAILQPSLKRN